MSDGRSRRAVRHEEVVGRLTAFLVDRLLDQRAVRPDLNLYAAGYIDSLRAIDFANFVEAEYGVLLTEEELDRSYPTLRAVAARICAVLAGSEEEP